MKVATDFIPLWSEILPKKKGFHKQELDQIPGTGKDQRPDQDRFAQLYQKQTFFRKKTSCRGNPSSTDQSRNSSYFRRVPAQPKPRRWRPNSGNESDGKIDFSKHNMKSSLETSAHVQSFIEVDVTHLWTGENKSKLHF